MTSVAEIALEVFTALAAELPDVVKACTLTKVTQGAYDATAGSYGEATATYTGQAIITTGGTIEGLNSTIKDVYPAYVAGPTDINMILQGLSAAPEKNDKVTIGSNTWTITLVGDVVGVGELFIIVAAPSA
jgi:hypothetical protein